MAVSKNAKAPELPNAAAFARLIDEGLADAEVVSQAYQAALTEWKRRGGRVDDRGAVPDVRPEPDPATPEARLIALGREALFVNEEPHTKRVKRTEEEA